MVESSSDDFIPISNVKKVEGLRWYYLQYLLITGLYMLEPWERKLFNSVGAIAVGFLISFLYFAVPALTY